MPDHDPMTQGARDDGSAQTSGLETGLYRISILVGALLALVGLGALCVMVVKFCLRVIS